MLRTYEKPGDPTLNIILPDVMPPGLVEFIFAHTHRQFSNKPPTERFLIITAMTRLTKREYTTEIAYLFAENWYGNTPTSPAELRLQNRNNVYPHAKYCYAWDRVVAILPHNKRHIKDVKGWIHPDFTKETMNLIDNSWIKERIKLYLQHHY